ncbi:MAG: SCO family protein [Sandaracinaceae bacterium]|nr:SCO family protein [Sandaracinaceae bacterium]
MSRLRTTGFALVLASAMAAAAPCAAHDTPASSAPPGLDNVTVVEHLDQRIPLDLEFRDHTGQTVVLRELLSGDRPVLLNLVYHSCTTFCSVVLDGVAASLNQQQWTAGVEYEVLTISIDPRDTPEDAARVRARILGAYGRDAAQQGWHFLVAPRTVDEQANREAFGVYPEIERLAAVVGFGYEWMPRTGQYAHPGVIMLLTPDGRVARYLYGLEYDTNDVRLGLLEASEGRSITTAEQVLLYCYAYNANAQGYTLVAWRIMRVGGALTAVLLFSFLGFLWWRDRKRHLAVPAPSGPLARVDR